MAKSGKVVTSAREPRPEGEQRFALTLRQMLRTPPTPHEKTKGAAPKRDPSSSGKGSKG